MSRTRNIVQAKARRLKGMIKESDGIALGDERLRTEGRREKEAALAQERRAREGAPRPGRPRRPEHAPGA
ncbi:hypothetical protein [uncultured Streptomyces sp.]|uniref:hypothetical protein n=1 Tax=uncultured Streptomyces sp. TaxID=174707 RepID=UPI00260BB7C0|nr:hypothetical protein [uncultured Streptomyces sp.]